LTGLSSRSGRQGCWRCPPVQPQRAPPLAPLGRCPFCNNNSRCTALLRFRGHHFFCSGGCRLCAPLRSRGLALHLRQELFDSGGSATTPSGFPDRVPLSFVSLINGLRRQQFLQARKLSHQQVNS
jgi:hypothetical protein